MLACLVSFANEYHVFHCHAVIKKNSYGLVIISRYGVLKTVRTRGPYMHMCICACAHCFHATATNPPWHCAINWRFSSWLSRIFGEIMDPCRHILSTMWTLDTYNVYLYKKTQLTTYLLWSVPLWSAKEINGTTDSACPKLYKAWADPVVTHASKKIRVLHGHGLAKPNRQNVLKRKRPSPREAFAFLSASFSLNKSPFNLINKSSSRNGAGH